MAGARTCCAKAPLLDQWLDRAYGELTFHMTQLIAGHGCFQTYLCRIGKTETATCIFCEQEDDSPDHTLQRCEAWREGETLCSSVGQDLSFGTVILRILVSPENWDAFVTFAETVMLAKEEDERARERFREDSVDTI